LACLESDVVVNCHPNFNSLLAYCTCSANPGGPLVLNFFGTTTPHLFELSDDIWYALQLRIFWQDIAIGLLPRRIYLPQEDIGRFGYSLE